MELWHALNRGVDKRTIFMDSSDRTRFIHDLYAFNDRRPAANTWRPIAQGNMFDFVSRTCEQERIPLVDVHGWCLMGNHYHLLLSEREEGGLVLFMRKLNVGYAKYFNERYNRTGTLFQGRSKKILIERSEHFLHILHYIHLNPLDLHANSREWRTHKIVNANSALDRLAQYRWSSYQDYCGNKNFPSILTKTVYQNMFGDYRKALEKYVRSIEFGPIQDLTLE